MDCLDCCDAPVCKAQTDIYIARLKMIQTAVDQYDYHLATERIQAFEQFLHERRNVITEA